MKRLIPLAALAGVFAVVWVFQSVWMSEGLARDRYNVVVISLDGLRPDHMTGAGYPRPTTAGIDKLAEDAVRFRNVISPSPGSLQAHASIFTSTNPGVHSADPARNLPLSEDWITLAEELQVHEYDTVAFVDGGDLDPRWNLNQGFSRYEVVPKRETEKETSFEKFRRKIYDANRYLAEREPEQPFFLFFQSRILREPFLPSYPRNQSFDPDYPNFVERTITSDYLRKLERGEVRLDSTELRHIAAQYDGEIATVDLFTEEWLTRLFTGGEFLENTIFVLLSTQGTELFEHGEIGGEGTMFDTSLRVPMYIWIPGVSGRSVDSQVRLIDVMPTLYDLLGIDPTEPMQGKSLVTRIQGIEDADLPAFSERFQTTYAVQSLRADGYRLLHDRKLAAPVLFDTNADPLNQVNIAPQNPERTEAMKAKLESMVRDDENFPRPTSARD